MSFTKLKLLDWLRGNCKLEFEGVIAKGRVQITYKYDRKKRREKYLFETKISSAESCSLSAKKSPRG